MRQRGNTALELHRPRRGLPHQRTRPGTSCSPRRRPTSTSPRRRPRCRRTISRRSSTRRAPPARPRASSSRIANVVAQCAALGDALGLVPRQSRDLLAADGAHRRAALHPLHPDAPRLVGDLPRRSAPHRPPAAADCGRSSSSRRLGCGRSCAPRRSRSSAIDPMAPRRFGAGARRACASPSPVRRRARRRWSSSGTGSACRCARSTACRRPRAWRRSTARRRADRHRRPAAAGRGGRALRRG